MTINDVIDINLLNRFLTKLKNLFATKNEITNLLNNKQDVLESGTNIKTINNESILGSGNITIQGGGSGDVNVIEGITMNGSAITPDANKVVNLGTVITQHQDISGKANSADLATVATSGSYNDLSNKPTIPTVPTNVSDFTNDAGYLTPSSVITIYSGSSDPNSSLGNNGDIYIKIS